MGGALLVEPTGTLGHDTAMVPVTTAMRPNKVDVAIKGFIFVFLLFGRVKALQHHGRPVVSGIASGRDAVTLARGVQ